MGLDGEPSSVKIDPSLPTASQEVQDVEGNVVEMVYNPGVGKYDVCVTTGPSYMTKRQEAREGMIELLQGNPQLWGVAGDLFAKEMDWPGAQKLAERLRKTIDPKLLSDDIKSPELQAAEQQIEAMSHEMEQMHQMISNVNKSLEIQELKIKAYDSETKRISAIQSGMSEEQIQDIVIGTIHSAMDTGDIVGRSALPALDNPVEDQNEGLPTDPLGEI
jgi:hypothetical protein